MDIEKLKKLANNKIEAEDLTKQVRRQIKETTWAKQNMREGFSETFKPLISQFEDPGEESKKQNIFTQNKEMLQNQLALTQGIRNNQLALKGIKDQQEHFNRALEHFENLADMEELPGVGAIEDEEDDKDDQAQAPLPKDDQTQAPLPKEDKTPIAKFDADYFDMNLNNKEAQDILKNNGFDELPSHFFNKNVSEIFSLIERVNDDIKDYGKKLRNTAIIEQEGVYLKATPKNESPQQKTLDNIKNYNALNIYSINLNLLLLYKKKTGSGLFSNPKELLHRFELVIGSLAAGNNGVLPEFIQIAHRLRDLGILSNNQLNKLLRKVI